MRSPLRDRLKAIEPSFFDDKDIGIDSGEGWWPLIETLVQNASSRLHNPVWIPDGEGTKRPPTAEENPFSGFRVVQIKEKFGGLRFYCRGGTENFRGQVEFAESLSYQICEECGVFGATQVATAPSTWVRTLCKPCHLKG